MNRAAQAGLAAGLFLAVAVIDYLIGKSVSLWALYLVPVGLASWHFGLRQGWMAALLAEVWVFSLDHLLGSPYETYIAWYTGLFTECILFFATALLVARWRDAVDRNPPPPGAGQGAR